MLGEAVKNERILLSCEKSREQYITLILMESFFIQVLNSNNFGILIPIKTGKIDS
jgi:hypothetical protein